MLTIYHNPRCSKSREAIAYLEFHKLDFEVVLYMENPLNKKQIRQLLKKLNYKPIELVRTQESLWKENYSTKSMTDEDIIKILALNPRLIERPVIVKGDKAVVARPATNADILINQ